MSQDSRQKTYTAIELDFNQQIEMIKQAGKNRFEFALLHSPKSHRLLNKLAIYQAMIDAVSEEITVHAFPKIDAGAAGSKINTIKRYRVKIVNGKVKAKRDHEIGFKKGAEIAVILDNPILRQRITDESYLESNAILRNLNTIEQISALAMRMASEKAALAKQKKVWKASLPKKKKKKKESKDKSKN